ncbi:hypothetical protein N0V90_002235 [Kalmusia sp. IMI 367209]|nr:hypothetical protein N0V90_002235 [Kalmusia sp. IMI 367209]
MFDPVGMITAFEFFLRDLLVCANFSPGIVDFLSFFGGVTFLFISALIPYWVVSRVQQMYTHKFTNSSAFGHELVLDPVLPGSFPPDTPLLPRRVRRALSAASRRRSRSPPPPSPPPVLEHDAAWWLDRFSRPTTSSPFSAPINKFELRGLRRWETIIPKGHNVLGRMEFPAHSQQEDNTPAAVRAQGESNILTLPIVSPKVVPVEHLQGHLSPLTGPALVVPTATSTEEIARQADVESLQGHLALREQPTLAVPVTASTDKRTRPIGFSQAPSMFSLFGRSVVAAPGFPAPHPLFRFRAWTASSGPVYLPPRETHPLFKFQNWTASSGPVFLPPREPHPLFTFQDAPAPAPESTPKPPPKPTSVAVSAPKPNPRTAPATAPRRALARPALARAPAPVSSTAAPPVASAAARAPASATPTPSASVQVLSHADQNWSLPDAQLLALDISSWGMTEDELMEWVVPQGTLKPKRKRNNAEELAAQKDPLVMARRYGEIALALKKTTVLLRLQLLRSARKGFPQFQSFRLVRGMLVDAERSFKIFRDANASMDGFPGADFSAFADALRFFLKHFCVGLRLPAERWLVLERSDEGDAAGLWLTTVRKARFVAEVLGIEQPQ